MSMAGNWWVATMDEGVVSGPYATKKVALDSVHYEEYPRMQRRLACVHPGFWEAKVTEHQMSGDDDDAFVQWKTWWICTTKAGVAQGIPQEAFDNRATVAAAAAAQKRVDDRLARSRAKAASDLGGIVIEVVSPKRALLHHAGHRSPTLGGIDFEPIEVECKWLPSGRLHLSLRDYKCRILSVVTSDRIFTMLDQQIWTVDGDFQIEMANWDAELCIFPQRQVTVVKI